MKQITAIILGFFMFFSCSNNSANWEKAKNKGDLSAYREFLKNNPESEFADKAKMKIDSIENTLWDSVNTVKTVDAYKKYVSNFPDGKNIDLANKIIDSITVSETIKAEWKKCTEKNDINFYSEFIKKHPDNVHVIEAKKQIFIIKNPDYLQSLDAQKELFLIENPKFKDEYKKILDFFEKMGANDFSDISEYFAQKTTFEKSTFDGEESVTETLPYTQEQLYEYGFNNVSNKIIYQTFLNKTFNSTYGENTCSITTTPDQVNVTIGYWDNGAKGYFSITWEKENNEWYISKFYSSPPDYNG